MLALQAYHARERELRCVATEIPDLFMVQDCREQYALVASDDKFSGASCGSATRFRADLFYL